MAKVFVAPASPGLEVPRDYDITPPYRPEDIISADGEEVEMSFYIARRIAGGDLVRAEPPKSGGRPSKRQAAHAKPAEANPVETE